MKDKILKYNELTKRWLNACKWIESPERTEEEVDKWLPEFQKILRELSDLFLELKQNGIKVIPEELIQI